MLSAYNKLKAWCNRHEMECSSMEPYSELLGFDVAALREHHRIIQKASSQCLHDCHLTQSLLLPATALICMLAMC